MTDYKKVAQALDDFLKQNPDANNLVMGEDHTTEQANMEMLSDPDVISVLHQHGKSSIALERPAVFQDHVDNVMFENQAPEDFAQAIIDDYVAIGVPEEALSSTYQSYLAESKLIQTHAKLGSAVVYYDNPDLSLAERDAQVMGANQIEHEAQQITSQSMFQILQDPQAVMGQARETEGGMNRLQGWSKGEAYHQIPEVQKKYDQFRDIRMNDDDEQLRASHIQENSIEGAVVLAGHFHGAGHGDLDEKLGENTARLTVVTDMAAFEMQSQQDYNMGNEAPEGYLILEEGEIIPGSDAYKAAEEFDMSIKHAINPEAHAAPQQQQELVQPVQTNEGLSM